MSTSLALLSPIRPGAVAPFGTIIHCILESIPKRAEFLFSDPSKTPASLHRPQPLPLTSVIRWTPHSPGTPAAGDKLDHRGLVNGGLQDYSSVYKTTGPVV